MAFKIRSSKFRHIYGTIPKKDLCYENIRITRNTHDSNFCAVNPKFLAVVTETGGGGSFLCIPLKQVSHLWPLVQKVFNTDPYISSFENKYWINFAKNENFSIQKCPLWLYHISFTYWSSMQHFLYSLKLIYCDK